MPPGTNGNQSITRMRLERLVDERQRTTENMQDALRFAEDDRRPLNEFEEQQQTQWREALVRLDGEIATLTDDVDRELNARDVSAVLRRADEGRSAEAEGGNGAVVYRTFAAYARDYCLERFPILATHAARDRSDVPTVQARARENLERVQNTLTSDIEGLLPPQHIAQIMDLINTSRPVVNSARRVNLDRGALTYPKITGRPEVLVQATEKTEAGTAKMSVDMETLTAETFLGGGDLSWQAINWSSPDALQLWFDLAAEAYAMATETRTCTELSTASTGTITTPLGTVGTENFAAWRNAAIAAIASLYNSSGGRAKSNTLYLSAQRFFALAGLGTDQTLQVSSVGSLDIGSMTGTWAGLRVIGSYGFGANSNVAIVGDGSALLVGETPGAPVEMRAVEPAIGGMEVGIIGAFAPRVFDSARFMHLS
jgi:HK97 family phage major capsid protein